VLMVTRNEWPSRPRGGPAFGRRRFLSLAEGLQRTARCYSCAPCRGVSCAGRPRSLFSSRSLECQVSSSGTAPHTQPLGTPPAWTFCSDGGPMTGSCRPFRAVVGRPEGAR
jgi:hypothetical protein